LPLRIEGRRPLLPPKTQPLRFTTCYRQFAARSRRIKLVEGRRNHEPSFSPGGIRTRRDIVKMEVIAGSAIVAALASAKWKWRGKMVMGMVKGANIVS